jgi:hypothetical protein
MGTAKCEHCGKVFTNNKPMILARTLKAHVTKMHGPKHSAKEGPRNHRKAGHQLDPAERSELLEDLLRRALIALGIRV